VIAHRFAGLEDNGTEHGVDRVDDEERMFWEA
jgi:hypothetical protein